MIPQEESKVFIQIAKARAPSLVFDSSKLVLPLRY